MLRVVSFLCTYEDPEYLDATLTAFKWFPSKLYIIEGSWRSTHGYANTSPRSSAETYNVIDRHVDNRRVFLVQANEATETQQRQVGLDKAKEDGADWCWMLDSDEVYTRPLISMIAAQLAAASQSVYGFRVRSYNFINSFKTWYDGNYSRIHRVTPDAQFYQYNDVQWQRPDAQVVTLPEHWRFFHYNYVKKDAAPFWRKLHFHQVDDPTFAGRHPDYSAQGHYYKIPQDVTMYNFLGKHPRIMQDHPNITANIYNDSELQFSAL